LAEFNPSLLQLPSSSDLVRAFIHDLGNVLDTADGTTKPQQQIFFWRTAAAQSWKADRDCVIVGVYSGTHAVVTTVGMAYGGESQGVRTSGIIFVNSSSSNPIFVPMRYQIHRSDVVTFDSDIAGAPLILFIE